MIFLTLGVIWKHQLRVQELKGVASYDSNNTTRDKFSFEGFIEVLETCVN
jgi:hypothetical protein